MFICYKPTDRKKGEESGEEKVSSDSKRNEKHLINNYIMNDGKFFNTGCVNERISNTRVKIPTL